MNTMRQPLSLFLVLALLLTCLSGMTVRAWAEEIDTAENQDTVTEPVDISAETSEEVSEDIPAETELVIEEQVEVVFPLYSGTEDDLNWVLESDGTLTITGTGYMNYNVPWKAYASQITRVVIGEGVTTVASSAFYECVNLTSVSLPGTLKTINDNAFGKCIRLTSVEIPAGVTTIATSVFAESTALAQIRVDENNANYSNDASGVLFNKDKTTLVFCPRGFSGTYTVPETVKTIGYSAFESCAGLTGITFGSAVTNIEGYAFSNCKNLGNFVIPNGVATIGSYTFSNCDGITELTIPGSMVSLGSEAFNSCDKLATVVIEDGLVALGNWAFDNCKNLNHVTLPDTLISISEHAFYGCSSLTNITIPRKVTFIDYAAFNGCRKLTEIKFEGNAPTIDANAFSTYYDVESITGYYPAGDATWTDEVLNGSYGAVISWKSYDATANPGEDTPVYIVAHGSCGQTVTWQLGSDGKLIISGTGAMQFMLRSSAAPWSAYSDQITSIVVETGVATIADQAFADCVNVTKISVADTVVSVGSQAFAGCESLTDITFSGDAPKIAEDSFGDVDAKVHYPEDNKSWTESVRQDYGGNLKWNTYVEKTTPMYRLYNPNSGEHFYTGSVEERDMLVDAGWQYEGIAWNAPIASGQPVYRVYNPNSGDHHYTMSKEEVNMLVDVGWKYEGVAWNSSGLTTVPQYRLYNPNADCGSHHYTSSTEERDFLVSIGWIYEGIGWFGMLK